jgi:hypothetical protein
MPNEEDKKIVAPEALPKEEKDKHNALFAGVIFFMLLIIILWVMNLQMMLHSAPKKPNNDLNVDKFSQEFEQAFSQAGAKIGQLKNIDTSVLQDYQAELTATSSASTTIKK